MDKRKLSETLMAKKILLLGQKYKQHKKEERIFMKRNKKLVHEIQSYKETLKSINDERLALQKYIYEKKFTKAVNEGNNNKLKNSLSSCLNQLQVLQTKVINSCIETQRESLEGNRHSSKKPAESYTQESTSKVRYTHWNNGVEDQVRRYGSLNMLQLSSPFQEERTVSEEPCRQSREHSPLQDVPISYDGIVCKIEALNKSVVEPALDSPCDLPESKQELSLLSSLFCRRDTVPVSETTEFVPQESVKVLPERTCESDFQESENVPLESTCESDYQESENETLEETCISNSREPEILPENATLETCLPKPQLENEDMRGSPREEPFQGFETDSSEKAKFTEMLQRLSVKCKALESLRNYDMAQSLTIFESNPENTAMEPAITSSLEEDMSKFYKLQYFEISLPRVDPSTYSSLNSTIKTPKKRGRKKKISNQEEEKNQSIVKISKKRGRKKKEISNQEEEQNQSIVKIPKKRGRKKKNSNQEEEQNQRQRDATPDSASESSNSGRLPRRARNAVSYKEKTLNTKLRRS